MKKQNPLLAVIFLLGLILAGCSLTGGGTSGFRVQPGAGDTIPTGLPVVVTLAPLSGDETLKEMSREIIENSLKECGFEVVDFALIEERICKTTLIPCEFMDGNSRSIMQSDFNIEALFIAEISSEPDVSAYIGEFELKLIEVENTDEIWSGRLKNQKWAAKEEKKRSAAAKTVNKVINMLEKDLKSLRKDQQKQAKIEAKNLEE